MRFLVGDTAEKCALEGFKCGQGRGLADELNKDAPCIGGNKIGSSLCEKWKWIANAGIIGRGG